MSYFKSTTIKDKDGNLIDPASTDDLLKLDILKEILIELKINNQYLKHIVGEANEVVESDTEITK